MPPLEFSFEATPEMARVGARRFMSRRAGKALLFFGLIMGGCALLLIAGSRHVFLFVGLALGTAFFFRWSRYCKLAGVPYEEMSDPKTTVMIDDDGLTMSTADHSSTMKWGLFKEVWRYPDVWLLFFYTDSHYTLIPASALSDYAATKVAAEVTRAGGRVR